VTRLRLYLGGILAICTLCSGAFASSQLDYSHPSTSLTKTGGASFVLPALVRVQPFMAYKASTNVLEKESGKPALTRFNGSIVMTIPQFLASVALGEIDVARAIPISVGPTVVRDARRREAFQTQERAAFNELLALMAGTGNPGTIPPPIVTLPGGQSAISVSEKNGAMLNKLTFS